MGWQLRVEAWEAAGVDGDIVIADPDGIVEQVRHVPAVAATVLLQASPPWVHTPVGDWLQDTIAEHYRFVLHGTQRNGARIDRLQ
jgi:hypothetical protein